MKSFKIVLLSLAAFVTIILTQCHDKNQQGYIPYYPVDMYVGLNEPSNISLSTIGGWKYITGGSKGIIIFHKAVDEYVAYDRNCTFNGFDNNCVLLTVLSGEQAAIDTCCGSKFSLQGGIVLNGPATVGMVQYQTELNGQVLHIFN